MVLKNSLRGLYENFLSLVFKKKCLVCKSSKTDELLCKNCAKDIQYLSCFAHKIYLNIPIYSACLYQGAIKKLIWALKFNHKKQASIVLAEILFNYFKKLNIKNDIIISFVPSFCFKIYQRGYNHMYLIAKEFSKLGNFELINDLILKTKYTKPQYKARNRRNNIKDSFKINLNKINKLKGKTLIILDDITTSGSTAQEIINLFINQNIENIIFLTLSKTL